jgi:hypothetical protein
VNKASKLSIQINSEFIQAEISRMNCGYDGLSLQRVTSIIAFHPSHYYFFATPNYIKNDSN